MKLNAVPLEDQGDSGSAGAHFEKIAFGDEMMVANDTLDTRLTKMSLAVAADSGFYEVDLDLGEHYFWGKDEGCSILGTTCAHTTVDEFCNDENSSKCSDHFMYRSRCQNSEFSGTCSINLNSEWCKSAKTSTYKYYSYGEKSLCQNLGVEY